MNDDPLRCLNDTLPDRAAEDDPARWGDPADSDANADNDRWLREQVPPHHDQ